MARWDETWHRLIEWTNGRTQSERLSGLVLLAEGFNGLDPSHPLGGPDGGKDALCQKHGQKLVMAVYFPRGQKSLTEIKAKFSADLKGVAVNLAEGIVFVTNQELTNGQRAEIRNLASELSVEIYHLERLVAVLDQPSMRSIRNNFLGEFDLDEVIRSAVGSATDRLVSLQTGGDTFCYWMLYHFDLSKSLAHNFVVIRVGDYPLYDVRIRIRDLDAERDMIEKSWGEINTPADFLNLNWPLPETVYYRVFFAARNGQWHQDLQLQKSQSANCWLAATRVTGRNGRDEIFRHVDSEFVAEFGEPSWRQ
jgi:hypothetical protein